MRVVILGSGRGSNAEAILLAQSAGHLGQARVVQIFSDRPDAGILALGPRFGVPAQFLDPAPFRTKLEGEGEQRYIAAISACQPDLVVLAGFMRVLKPALLGAFAGRIINLHPSLLPSFPGLDGIGVARALAAQTSSPAVVFTEIDFETLDDNAMRRIFVGATRASLKLVLVVSERAAAVFLKRLEEPSPAEDKKYQ